MPGGKVAAVPEPVRSRGWWVLAIAMPLFLSLLILSAIMAAAQAWQPDGMHAGSEDVPVGARIVTVAASVLLISFFALTYLVPGPRGRDWRSTRLVQAFMSALYAEMYGFPLTVYLLASAMGLPGLPGVMGRLDGHLLAHGLSRLTGVSLAAASWAVMAASSALMALGFFLIYAGWRQIHAAQGQLVTRGVYGVVRHPQYVGILVLILGLLVHWPTIVTVLMWPVIAVTYVRLAGREERLAEAAFGERYLAYRRLVPAFVPRTLRRGSSQR